MSGKTGRALLWVGGISVVIVIAVAVVVANLDLNRAKGYIAQGVSKATGRELKINGDITLDWGWTTILSARGIQFANADWSKHPQMLEVGGLELEIDLWQLLTRFRPVVPLVTLIEPNVVLEKNSEGKANWEFRASTAVTEPVKPDRRTEFPVVERLVVKDGALLYHDQRSGTRADLKLVEAQAAGFLNAPITLKAQGSYQKLPLSLSLQGGSYENLRSAQVPYPVRIELAVGKQRAKIEGEFTEPLELKGENVLLDIEGDDMANLYPIIRLVFPQTPPYRLRGYLKHEGKVWSFSDFSGRVGDSDLTGEIRVDTAPERPMLKADLASKLLDFDDLAGFIGGKPDTGLDESASKKQPKKDAEKDSDRIFPDQRYDLERLNAMDADVKLRAKKILAPDLPIDNLNATLKLSGGVLRFAPAAFGVASGRLEIFSTFDGSKRPSGVKIDARIRQLDLRRFLPKESFAQKTLAPVSGRINLSGTGESFRELMATVSGNTFFAMSGGEISAMLIELAGLDVAESLGRVVRGDEPIEVRCALLDLKGQNGRMAVETFVFDTADTVVYGEGNVNLRDERLNLVILPVPKDFSPLSLRSYIRVSGPLADPSVFPDPIKTGTDSLIKKAFNVLTLLFLSPFQPRDLGRGSDVDCDKLMAGVQAKDPQGIVAKELSKTARQHAGAKKPPSQN